MQDSTVHISDLVYGLSIHMSILLVNNKYHNIALIMLLFITIYGLNITTHFTLSLLLCYIRDMALHRIYLFFNFLKFPGFLRKPQEKNGLSSLEGML